MKRIAELKRFGMKNCVPIQAWWRGEMARERVRRIRRRAAAGLLQRTLRMFSARLLASRLREQVAKLRALRTKSARQVQRVYRGLKGRLCVGLERRMRFLCCSFGSLANAAGSDVDRWRASLDACLRQVRDAAAAARGTRTAPSEATGGGVANPNKLPCISWSTGTAHAAARA